MTPGADTRLYGLIGWPLGHSLSPLMHNAAFGELGIDALYLPLPVAPALATNVASALASLGFRGANVTVPHKQSLMAQMDMVSEDAQIIGAINTIVVDGHDSQTPRCIGHNTDHVGFCAALEDLQLSPDMLSSVVLVGSGGAARAVLHGLCQLGAPKICILSRDVARARQSLATLIDGRQVLVRELDHNVLYESCRHAQLLINASPVGMGSDESIWPDELAMPTGMAVMDLVYGRRGTRLQKQAAQAGCSNIDGRAMLLAQAVGAFCLWYPTVDPRRVKEIMAKSFKE